MTAPTRNARQSPVRPSAGAAGRISQTVVGAFAEAIRLAQRELLSAAQGVRDEYGLGPRGTWIIGLIATGRVKTQSDVVKRYGIGRSIIAEEMAQLTRSGLVHCAPSAADRRHLDLTLTPLGLRANRRMGEALVRRLEDRLGGAYSAEDVRFCIDLLLAVAGQTLENQPLGAPPEADASPSRVGGRSGR